MEIKREFIVDDTFVFNPRSARIQPFVDRLNESRRQKNYKPYPFAFVASKMSHIKTEELEYFYKKLESARNFSKLWHWYCCPKKK